jgi:amino-acid N-acetyltransferase
MYVNIKRSGAMQIERATVADLASILALLEQSGLPQDGLSEHITTALIARDVGGIVGSAALEHYGAAALLRSVAVAAAWRGQGLGQRLTAAALDMAREGGVTQVYLLTETAADFFPRFGFRPIARAEVDSAVQQSVEFTSACPDSALAMVVDLTRNAQNA